MMGCAGLSSRTKHSSGSPCRGGSHKTLVGEVLHTNRSLHARPLPAAAWLASGDWAQQLEALLTVRQPSEEDLAEVRQAPFWVSSVVRLCRKACTPCGLPRACRDPSFCPTASHPAPPAYPAVQLLCNLKVSWGPNGTVVRSSRAEQSAFAADLNRLTDGLEQVGGDACQGHGAVPGAGPGPCGHWLPSPGPAWEGWGAAGPGLFSTALVICGLLILPR